VVGIEANEVAAADLRALGLCDAVVAADARDALAVRRAVLDATGGREADVTFSCVSVADAEMAAVLSTRDRGVVYFFAMSTSFTRAALGAEGVGKDVDLFIGNGFAHGHADHTLAMLRDMPALRALFERRYAQPPVRERENEQEGGETAAFPSSCSFLSSPTDVRRGWLRWGRGRRWSRRRR